MAFMRELSLRAFVVFFFRLLLADVACSYLASWLAYFVVGRRHAESKQVTMHAPGTFNDAGSGLKVIICGFPRSGTMSLQHAMNILGFPCFHGRNLLKPSTSKLFLKAVASGRLGDWQRLLQGYAAIADVPAAACYKQLMVLFPDAKVILNTRNPEKWYHSFSQTVLMLSHNGPYSLIYQIVRPCAYKCASTVLYQGILKGKPNDKEFVIATYKQHIEEVKQHVPPNKLLVYAIEKHEGWAPLCHFLEVPIPDLPFPSVNDREFFNSVVRLNAMLYGMVLASYVGFLSCIIAFLLKWKIVW